MVAPFRDRTAAGRALAPVVERWCADQGLASPVVLGIPRGGVVVAAPVAETLGAPLGVVVVRKLGAPGRPEYAVGAIAEGVRVTGRGESEAHHSTDVARVEAHERAELARRTRLYSGGVTVAEDADAVVVDDGVATGSTAIAALRSLRPHVRTLLLAVPVAPADWQAPTEADGYVCPNPVRDFWAVGQHYLDFSQTSDDEVVALLAAARAR